MNAFTELIYILKQIDNLQVRITDQDTPGRSPWITITPQRETQTPQSLKGDRLTKVYTGELQMLTYLKNLLKDVDAFESLKNVVRNKIHDNRTLNNQVADCKVESSATIIKKGATHVQMICTFIFRTTEFFLR